MHCPEVHCSFWPQTFPHEPQLSGSVFRSTQDWPHLVRPAPHWLSQLPWLQTSSCAQALSHEPQLSGSVEVFTHWPEHSCKP
jgi:hypothetical protein